MWVYVDMDDLGSFMFGIQFHICVRWPRTFFYFIYNFVLFYGILCRAWVVGPTLFGHVCSSLILDTTPDRCKHLRDILYFEILFKFLDFFWTCMILVNSKADETMGL